MPRNSPHLPYETRLCVSTDGLGDKADPLIFEFSVMLKILWQQTLSHWQISLGFLHSLLPNHFHCVCPFANHSSLGAVKRPLATVMFHVTCNCGLAQVMAVVDGFVVGVLFRVFWLRDVPDFAQEQCDCGCCDVIVEWVLGPSLMTVH